jgi:hypothetical protein
MDGRDPSANAHADVTRAAFDPHSRAVERTRARVSFGSRSLIDLSIEAYLRGRCRPVEVASSLESATAPSNGAAAAIKGPDPVTAKQAEDNR